MFLKSFHRAEQNTWRTYTNSRKTLHHKVENSAVLSLPTPFSYSKHWYESKNPPPRKVTVFCTLQGGGQWNFQLFFLVHLLPGQKREQSVRDTDWKKSSERTNKLQCTYELVKSRSCSICYFISVTISGAISWFSNVDNT